AGAMPWEEDMGKSLYRGRGNFAAQFQARARIHFEVALRILTIPGETTTTDPGNSDACSAITPVNISAFASGWSPAKRTSSTPRWTKERRNANSPKSLSSVSKVAPSELAASR